MTNLQKALSVLACVLALWIGSFTALWRYSTPVEAAPVWTVVNGAILEDYSSPPMITPTVTLQATGGPNWRFATQPVGATFRIISRLNCAMNAIQTARSCGMFLYDGTKVEAFDLLWTGANLDPSLRIVTTTTVSGSPTTLAGPTSNLVGTGVTLQIIDNGTTRTFYYWKNGGFTQFYQEASHTFLVPTSAGFGGGEFANAAGTLMSVMCMIWSYQLS